MIYQTTRPWLKWFWFLISTAFVLASCNQSDQSVGKIAEELKVGGKIEGLTWNYEYDPEGRLSGIQRPGDIRTRITYSQQEINGIQGETINVEVGNSKQRFNQDSRGLLLSAEGEGDKIVFKYNPVGFPSEVHTDGGPTLRYAYDVQNRLARMSIGEETILQYRYDYLGRLNVLVTPIGNITYQYHRASNTVVRRLPNGLQTFRIYNDEGKLSELTHVDSKEYILAKYAYVYRPDGLIKEIRETNQRFGEQVCQYQYDLMQRLTTVDCRGEDRTYRYRYDLQGNLAELQREGEQPLVFTSTPAGALASDSRGVSKIDDRGHVRLLPHSATPIDYDFNDAGQLAAAQNGSIQYSYNPLGLLKTRVVNGQQVQYLPDPFAEAWQPVWRHNADGTEDVIIWDGAIPLIELRDGKAHYRLEDHLGSVRIELDGRGEIQAWHDYSPFGLPKEVHDGEKLVPAFAGLYWDPLAKVYHAMARAYDPITARFLQPDPKLRVPDALKHNHSLYAYSGGDPVNFVDRNGAEAKGALLGDRGHRNLTWTFEFGKAFSSGVLQTLRDQKQLLGQFYGDQLDVMTKFYSKENLPKLKKYFFDYDSPPELIWGPTPGTIMDKVFQVYPPIAREQVFDFDSRHKAAIIERLNLYQSQISRADFGKPWDELPLDKKFDVRKLTVEKFAADLASYPGSREMTKENLNFFSEHMGNIQIKTWRGPVNVDHLTTTIDAGNRWFSFSLPKESGDRYAVYKSIHNTLSPYLRIKDLPEVGNEFPEGDLNAVGIIPDLLDARQSFDHIFREGAKIQMPPTAPKTIPISIAPRNEITTQAHNLTNVIMSQINVMSGIQRKYDIAGGDGRVAGPGGFASSQGYDALAAWRSHQLTSPSPVGGVYLGGAGKVMKGLENLKGIAIDKETGKLVLIGSHDKKIALPALRLDDVVTIFRAVYDYGQSPSVTIDPDEEDPEGPLMDVKHGPGTEETYVGWILFECDRVMKTYQLGEDNDTHNPVASQVPDYFKMLDAVYFGGEKQFVKSEGLLSRFFGFLGNQGRNWERFWIVPSSVSRFDDKTRDLSLFEVPLKVNTQKMRWENGRLVDDNEGESSFGAKAFQTWFSDHYDEIADEVLLSPPPESGLKNPVPIFHELRRIASITAIAERLRDSGVTMPAWMRDYPVKSLPVPKDTPSLNLKRTKKDGTFVYSSKIFGGVNLAPSDKDVYIHQDVKQETSKTVPSKYRAFVEESRIEAKSIEPKIHALTRDQRNIGEVQALTYSNEKTLTVAVLPGAKTRALAPNRQRVTDMIVPIGLGRDIRLTRYYNSFFEPEGSLGKGWTFDLPRLLMSKVPVKRDGKRSQYRVVPHLVSPLATLDIRFDQVELVKPFEAEIPVAQGYPEIVGVVSGHSEIIEENTHQVVFRDGRVWHFDDKGLLVLMQSEGTAIRYLRNAASQVQKAVGYVGAGAVAEIQFEYDSSGRIRKAKQKQDAYLGEHTPSEILEIAYEYDEDGRLGEVVSMGEIEDRERTKDWTYSYSAGRLARIWDIGQVESVFEYDDRGQLLWVKQGNRKTTFSVETNAQGTVLNKSASEGSIHTKSENWTFDPKMRPLVANLADGQIVQWRYGNNKYVSKTLLQGSRPVWTQSTSEDGRIETTEFFDGPAYELRRDVFGRPIHVSIDGILLSEFSWHSDGTLEKILSGQTEIRPRKHKDGWLNGVLISKPMNSGKTDEWLEEEWDIMGRPIKITDSSGFGYTTGYDDQGRISTLQSVGKGREGINTHFVYDDHGLVESIDSFWGTEERKYYDDGTLNNVKVERQEEESILTFDQSGRPVKHLAFGGGVTRWDYDTKNAGSRLKTIYLPNDNQINYLRDDSDKGQRSDISLGSAVVRVQSDDENRVTMMAWGEIVH